MLSSFGWMIHEVVGWAAVLADSEAGDRATAVAEVETDQGLVQAAVEDPDRDFSRIGTGAS